MGVPWYFCTMFLRKKKKSGSISVQIISKAGGKYRVIKTIGSGKTEKGIESLLYKEESTLSVKKASVLTHNMYQITYILPNSRHIKSKILKMDEKQQELYEIINKKF